MHTHWPSLLRSGNSPDNITATMDEADVFPVEAADVAIQAIKDGVARRKVTWDEAYAIAKRDIEYSRSLTHSLCDTGFIKNPPEEMLQDALQFTIKEIEG